LAQFQIRTPIDDEHVLHFWYTLYDVPEGYEDVIARTKQISDTYVAKLQGPDGSFLMDTIDSQDAMAWVTQGAITDRSDEHLCASDRGVVLYRNQVEEQIVAVENGKDPLNVYSPEDAPTLIDLPMEQKDVGLGGGGANPLASFLRTQSRHSDRVKLAVQGIDQVLGLPERETVDLNA
jgi:5,5'-dehydrodivanillate O-demethylase